MPYTRQGLGTGDSADLALRDVETCISGRPEGSSARGAYVKSSLRRTLEQIAHDAGLAGVIEAIPDDILEEAFLNFLNCPACAGDGEAAAHGHNPARVFPMWSLHCACLETRGAEQPKHDGRDLSR